MKVLINITSIKHPLTGIGYYTLHILKTLLDQKVDVIGLLSGSFLRVDQLNELIDSFNNKESVINKHNLISNVKKQAIEMIRTLPYMYYIKKHFIQSCISLQLNKLANEGYVYFEPNYIPFKFNGPILTTIHDLSFLTFPEFHPPQRVAHLKKNIVHSINRSSTVIVDTDFILNEMHQHFPISKGKTSTVHLAVSTDFRPLLQSECIVTLQKFNLSYQKYILSVATLEPRKNLKRLVMAYKLLPIEIRNEYPLVLVGNHGWKNSDLMKESSSLIENKQIIISGHVSDVDLKTLYAGANLFVYPSLYEGFGLPVLEAMASGIPVITSGNGATAEVSGNSAIHIDPYSEQDICNAIQMIISNERLRLDLIEKGFKRSRDFKWEYTTKKVLKHLSLLSTI